MYVSMYVSMCVCMSRFWPRGEGHAQRANVTGSIKGLKVTVNQGILACSTNSPATSTNSLLMKSLGFLFHHNPTRNPLFAEVRDSNRFHEFM